MKFIKIFKYILISIPYGAIKRYFLVGALRMQKGISIPYGAIKSCCLYNNTIIKIKFQFLMVRLKAKTAFAPIVIVSNFNSLWCD